MKQVLKGMLLAVVVGVLIGGTAFAGTITKTVYQDYGTVTYKFAIDSDSNEAIGHYHKSSGALKTPWVDVPFGVPFTIFYETRDADSAASAYYPWGPDTIGFALETAPSHGLVVDSLTQYKRNKADILWDLRSVTWTDFTGQHFFPQVYADTLNDTVAINETSLKSGTANKQTTPLVNLGKLRFSVCVDYADSVLDGKLRMNAYIVFQAPEAKQYMQFTTNDGAHYEWAQAGEPTKSYAVVEQLPYLYRRSPLTRMVE